jgi:methionyl-tRNA formyltransferase
MRFAYAGIDFLADVYDALIAQGWEPVKIFTRPCDGIYDSNDHIIGLGTDHKIPVQMSRLRSPDFEDLERLQCEALIVAGYPWLIKGWERQVRYGVNIHPSPLPIGRGPYPLIQAILEQRTAWGITAHKLDPSFDTGAILAQEAFPMAADETHDTLLSKVQLASKSLGKMLARHLSSLWDKAVPQQGGSYWAMPDDVQSTLNWSKNVADIMRTVRAFGLVETKVRVNGKLIHVQQAQGWVSLHDYKPGTLVHEYRRQLVIAVADGFVQMTAWSPIDALSATRLGR